MFRSRHASSSSRMHAQEEEEEDLKEGYALSHDDFRVGRKCYSKDRCI